MKESKAQQEEVRTEHTSVYKCSSCGADMYFDIALGKMKCPYCGNEVDIPANVLDVQRSVENFDEKSLKHSKNAVTYKCPNCHAVTEMVGVYDTAAKCPFCGATNIVRVEDMPGLAPDVILPFKVTKDAASQYAKKWVKKKLYAPKKLKKSFVPDSMNSVYCPSFSFDVDTYTSYELRLGEKYTVTVGTGNNRHTETRIKYFTVRGSLKKFFDDMLIEVSPKLSQGFFEQLGAFDTKNAVEYKEEFISGHASERYDTSVNEAYLQAKAKIKERIRSTILAKYTYDVIDYERISTNFNNSNFKYILVPIWCSAFKYRNKLYNFFVNGRTGRVGGKTPVSVAKVLFTAIGIAAICVILYVIYTYA